MVSNSQAMDNQRQQYIPGLPGPPPPPPSQPHLMHLGNLPPPPPRPHPQSQSTLPPPPPGPHPSSLPPGTVYGIPGGWQQGWGRPGGLPQGIPPPPPMINVNQAQNQHLAYSASHLSQQRQQPAQLNIPPPPPQYDKPILSATFIPGGDSFGPGVGIPPLEDYTSSYSRYDTHLNAEPQRSYSNPAYVETPVANHSFSYPVPTGANVPGDVVNREGRAASASSNRNVNYNMSIREVQEPLSPGLAKIKMQNPQGQNVGQSLDKSLSIGPGQRQRASSAAFGSSTTPDMAAQWPLDRVLLWLAANGFSDDWQETFRILGLQGADFLELGRGANGRGNLETLHQVVYPQLAKVCSSSKTGWDQATEREEGKRMRRLIRRIADSNSSEKASSASSGHRRNESGQLAGGSMDSGTEPSTTFGRSDYSGMTNTSGPESSPGRPLPSQLASDLAYRNSQSRSTTLPVYPKQNGPTQISNDGKKSESLHGQNRADFTKAQLAAGGLQRRHSPNPSLDASRIIDDSPGASPALGHVAPTSAVSNSSSSSHVQNRGEHSRADSTDSLLKISGHGRGSESSRGGSGMGYYENRDNRRDAQEMSRASPSEGPREYASGPGGKEHGKGGLFGKFIRKKPEAAQSGPEDQIGESPTSPNAIRQMGPSLPFANQKSNASDASIAPAPRPASTSAIIEEGRSSVSRQSASERSSTRKYILVTPDQWNYRLIDVTDAGSAKSLRNLICFQLGVEDSEYTQIFITEPAQTDHQVPLTDDMLISLRRAKSDHLGSLKFYVRSPVSSATSFQVPWSAGLGMSFAQRSGPPPMLRAEAMVKSHSSGATSRDVSFPNHDLSSNSNRDRNSVIQSSGDEQKGEKELRQKSSFEPRQQRRDNSTYTGSGIRGSTVIDFDSPRASPFEDKKTDSLVPVRKPPAAPSESSTLTKVNSLSRKSGDKIRLSISDALKGIAGPIAEETAADRGRKRAVGATPSVSQGIGAALANVGKMAGAPATAGSQGTGQEDSRHRALRSIDLGQRSTSPGGSPRPDFTWGKGNMLFKVPDYEEGGESRSRDQNMFKRPQNPAVQDLQRHTVSPAISPATEVAPQRPPFVSRPSRGPGNEFKETHVTFASSPNVQRGDDSDDDSDDGLFAIPIPKKQGSENGDGDGGNIDREQRPTLTVNTDQQQRNKRVTIKSPSSSGTASTGPSAPTPGNDDSGSISESAGLERSYSDASGSFSGSAISPDDRGGRRESFVSTIWANRPAVENVVNHLDEFFPGVDLDKPYLEERGDPSSSDSASDRHFENTPLSLRGRANTYGTDDTTLEFTNRSESDTLGSNESTLKAKDRNTVTSVVQKRTNKPTGLGRMKSIREVARGRNDVTRAHSSVAYAQHNKSGGLLRRKSTKMFGANIVQIKPKPGTRLSTLDPIPQEEVPTEETPKRQPTFKILRGQLIGKGTYGRVYLGMNANTGEFLAVKQVEVNQKIAGQDKDKIKSMVAALDLEIDTMQHLEHPNIVQYLGCERREFSISIYLEYISGGSVGSCLRKHGKFEEPVVRSLTRQTLEGLSYLHGQGILHRDLKADNILLDLDGSCKISDFGISKKSDNIYGNDITNSMQGSVFWMAPEVVRSQGQGYSAKVDIWSLGCVVLEMFAGKRPWSREEAIGAIFKLGSLGQAPPIPEDVSETASVDGLNFMYDCFQVDPSDRPTAVTLLHHSTFCVPDPFYNFYDTGLADKLRSADVAP